VGQQEAYVLDDAQAQEILIDELEKLLEEEAPKEVDSAALYVENPEQFQKKGADERAFGIPGSGFAFLAGPVLMTLVLQVAKMLLEELTKKGAEVAAQSALGYVKRKLLGPPPEQQVKAETIAAITQALIQAGWNTKKAAATAEKVWRTGIQTSQRLASQR
jgi:hypothetical protein